MTRSGSMMQDDPEKEQSQSIENPKAAYSANNSVCPPTTPSKQNGSCEQGQIATERNDKPYEAESPSTSTPRPGSPIKSRQPSGPLYERQRFQKILQPVLKRIGEHTAKDTIPGRRRKRGLNRTATHSTVVEEGCELFRPNQFRELYKLGSGGLCDVYAVCHDDGRVFARSALNPFTHEIEYIQAFDNEIKIAQRLKGIQHVVSIEGTLSNDDQVDAILWRPVADGDLDRYFRECTGGSHSDLHKQCLRLHLQTFFGSLAITLRRIHQRDIQHKDIKPANILFLGSKIYIADFNISKDTTGQPVTSTDGPIKWQTYLYSAPEVGRNQPRGRPADIFSLGTVFLEMLTVICAASLPLLRTNRKPYWDNIPFLLTWLDDLNLPDFFAPEDGDEFPKIKKIVASMLQDDPRERPTAAELKLPRSWCCTCCQPQRDEDDVPIQELVASPSSEVPVADAARISCISPSIFSFPDNIIHRPSLPSRQKISAEVRIQTIAVRKSSPTLSQHSSASSNISVLYTPPYFALKPNLGISSSVKPTSDAAMESKDHFPSELVDWDVIDGSEDISSTDGPWRGWINIGLQEGSRNLPEVPSDYNLTKVPLDDLTHELERLSS